MQQAVITTTPPVSDAGREFRKQEARELQQQQRVCELFTNGPNSTYIGQIEEVTEGGLLLRQSGSNKRISLVWEQVDHFNGLPTSVEQQREQSLSASAGVTTGRNRNY